MDLAPLQASDAPDRLPAELAAQLSPEERSLARRYLTFIAILGSGSMVGVAASFYLANHHPLLLIALSPIGRHLILVAPTVSPVPFVAVGALRRLAFYVPCFQLGRLLGTSAITWLESKSPRAGRFVGWLQRLFDRAAYPVLFFMPGPAMCTIAGTSGMRLGTFVVIAGSGLVFRMLIILTIGEWLKEPIEAVLAWVDEYWVEGTGVMVMGVLIHRLWQQRLTRKALRAD